ncbi:class II aldolase/adducin family protein [Iodidimonas sp. SYSU 1G8]|uniref:class II aldolase/adducin family protein n=1 Tax=Iodidimonas sp. SYSU 1G8 TaxID=3133967 RepID=UPI0031FE78B6
MTASDRHSIGQSVIDACLAMTALGVNHGTSGNGSARWLDGFLVTPTGLRYETLTPADMVYVTLDGQAHGTLAPSSEWRMHCDIYRARPDMNAVLHAHPPYATALACLREGIPCFHYMVAAAGGPDIRCAGYAVYGSAALSAAMLVALEGRKACLLANHGMIVCETTMARALSLAVEVEALARQYCIARQTGTPVLLSEAEMDEALARYAGYGRQAGGTS